MAARGRGFRSIRRVAQLVVYRRDKSSPRGPAARIGEAGGQSRQSSERTLEKLKKTVAPTLPWAVTAPSNADPLADVDSGEADYALQ